MLSVLAPIRSVQFRKYFVAASLSAVGDGMQVVAIAWYVFHRTGSVSAIGTMLIVQTIPGLFLAPLAGALVDRWNVKIICVATDLIQGSILFGLALAIIYDRWTLPAIYVATLLMAICRRFCSPALSTMVRDISKRDALLSANILSSTTLQMGMLCGASIGGFLVASVGASSVILLNAVSFLISAGITAWIQVVSTRTEHATTIRLPIFGDLREAVTYARREPLIRWLALVDLFDTMAINTFNTLLPAFVSRELRGGPQSFGLIEGAWGGGALLGGLLLSAVANRFGQRNISIAGPGCLSLLIIFFLISQTTLHAMLAYFILGIFVCAVGINTNTLLATEVSSQHFGKVKSFIFMFDSYAGIAIFTTISVLGDHVSPRLIFGSVSALIMTGFIWKIWTIHQRGFVGHAGASPATQEDMTVTPKEVT